jgi:hypothetical protein
MNRRNFLLSLVILPSVIKTVVQVSPKAQEEIMARDINYWFAHHAAGVRHDTLLYIARNDPYAQLIS